MKDFIANLKRILVVEDEPAICELCQRVLLAKVLKDVAADGKAAQSMIEKRHYDLFFIDVRVPALSGKELYMWLREGHPGSERRVVFTTGSTLSEGTHSFLRQCSTPVLLKPFDPEELKARISQALETVAE